MPVITLTSDWGLTDHYVGAVKGAILNRLPSAVIVDISHQVKHFDIRHAAFILRNSYRSFPEGSIHIIGFDSIESDDQPHVVVKANGHYFIGADTGLFSMILDDKPEMILSLNITQDTGYFTFPSRDRFAKAACHIAEGKDPSALGEPLQALNSKLSMKADVQKDHINGRVMYIDSYENVFLNITEKEFRTLVGNKAFTIHLRRSDHAIHKIVKAYGDVSEAEICALFSTSGLLEIAINRGKASSLLGLYMDGPVQVTLDE